MKQLLSTRQVAAALGISEASLKRWCDKGLLPVVRTVGGHRRLPVSGVVQFIRQHQHPLVKPEVLGLPPATGRGAHSLDRVRGLLGEALEAGAEEPCRRLVLNLYLSGRRVCEIGDEVLVPAMSSIGVRWEHGQVEVYQERRAVEICTRILHEIRAALSPIEPAAPLAIGATLEADPYTLPTALVELTLREMGWNAESYGIGHPAETLAAAIAGVRPRLFWLSVSTVPDPDRFVRQYAVLQEAAAGQGIPIVIGGRALTDDIRRRIDYAACCETLRRLVSFAEAVRGTKVESAG